MNHPLHPDNGSDAPWPSTEPRMPVADTSMLPGSEKAAPAAVGLLKNAVQGAHATIDRLADRATPAMHRLGDTGDQWLEDTRRTVRGKPLASVAVAFVLGAWLARITR